MTMKDWLRIMPRLLTCIILALILQPYANADESYEELNKEVLETVDRGLVWLKTQQGPDGLFRDHPGLTALAIAAFLRHPQDKYTEANHPFIQKSIKALLKMQQPDGGIYDIDKQPALPNYNTSISLMVLSSTKNPKYKDAITKAQSFIKGLQVTDTNSVYFGGIGYGSRETVHDLSNMSFAIQALKESGSDEQEVWDKAIKFLERCQNSSETNDQSWAGNDGGFIYAPDGESKAKDEDGKPKSYASMTYAGLLSLIYANVDKNDPRIQAAVGWIQKHFTVEENYGMGKQGLFYNYHTMAKALSVYADPIIVDAKGTRHDWYRELAGKLISEQTPQGFWKNDASRWMERDPVLVTSYSILALEIAYRGE
ncbi:MAG: prenyltransferase/squalene oxidase repeat-containing protein [Candidatus Poribacteria bacterium]